MEDNANLSDQFEFLVEQHIFGDLLAAWTDQGQTSQEVTERALIATVIMWPEGIVRVH